MCFWTQRRYYDDRPIVDNSNEIREVKQNHEKLKENYTQLQRELNQLKNQKRNDQEVDRKFREELLNEQKKSRERDLKNAAVIQEYANNIESLKSQVQEIQKSNIEDKIQKEKELKERLNLMEKQKRYNENLFKQQKEEESKLSDEEKNKIRLKIENYKKYYLSLVRENKYTEIDQGIQELEEEFILYKQYSIKNQDEILYLANIMFDVYETCADLFQQNNLYDKSEYLYNKAKELTPAEKLSNNFLFKYSSCIFKLCKYSEVVFNLEKVLQTKFKDNTMMSELDMMLFESYLAIQDEVKLKTQFEKMINLYSHDKPVMKQIMGQFEKYLQYYPEEKNQILYLSLNFYLKSKPDIEKILDHDSFQKFYYADFYKAVYEQRNANYNKSIELLSQYQDIPIASILIYKSKRLGKSLTIKDFVSIDSLIKDFSVLTKEKNIQLRSRFVDENKYLMYLNPEQIDDFFRFYADLRISKMDILLFDNQFEKFNNELNDFINELENQDFIEGFIKQSLRSYYHFYLKSQSVENTEKLLNLLKRFCNDIELNVLLSNNETESKMIDEIYEISKEKNKAFNSPYYNVYEAEHKINQNHYCYLETMGEHLNSDRINLRKIAIEKDIVLSKIDSCYSPVYEYEVEQNQTRMVLPDYTRNFKKELEDQEAFNHSNAKEKINYAMQLIHIFEKLESEKVVLHSLNPEQIMLNHNNQLVLRNVFFEQSFKSESQSSSNSLRYYKAVLYSSPDEKLDRDYKSNYYLLGLLLYELFSGFYIFEGVEDFSSINLLHREKECQKSKVIVLAERWKLIDEKRPLVNVDKLNENCFNPLLNHEIISELKSMLSANKNQRPDNLARLKTLMSDFNFKDLDLDIFNKPIHLNKIKDFIKKFQPETLYVNDEKLFLKFFQNTNVSKSIVYGNNISDDFKNHYRENIKGSGNFSNGLIIEKSEKYFQITHVTGALYIIKEIAEFSPNRLEDKETQKKNSTDITDNFSDDLKKLLIKINQLINTNSDEFSDFLYSGREQVYQCIENDKNETDFSSDMTDLIQSVYQKKKKEYNHHLEQSKTISIQYFIKIMSDTIKLIEED